MPSANPSNPILHSGVPLGGPGCGKIEFCPDGVIGCDGYPRCTLVDLRDNETAPAALAGRVLVWIPHPSRDHLKPPFIFPHPFHAQAPLFH